MMYMGTLTNMLVPSVIMQRKDRMAERDIKYSSICPLCRLWKDREIKTHVWYEDDKYIVVDCETCKIPMIVLKDHIENIPTYWHAEVERIMQCLFGAGEFRYPQKILMHWHRHWICK